MTNIRLDSPTLVALTISPASPDAPEQYDLTFFPMNNDRDYDGRIPGIAASLALTMPDQGWVLGAVTQIYLLADDPTPHDSENINEWANSVVNVYGKQVASLLWDLATSSLRSTAGLMKFLPIKVPDNPRQDIRFKVVPVDEVEGPQ
ncbi:hypothetical protein ABZS16_04085 [Trueperella pyogenes]|uniref:hypothetical protein n=1 Tax=Trueperella pyogenes TaxID=1661 RepID=UPI00339D7637